MQLARPCLPAPVPHALNGQRAHPSQVHVVVSSALLGLPTPRVRRVPLASPTHLSPMIGSASKSARICCRAFSSCGQSLCGYAAQQWSVVTRGPRAFHTTHAQASTAALQSGRPMRPVHVPYARLAAPNTVITQPADPPRARCRTTARRATAAAPHRRGPSLLWSPAASPATRSPWTWRPRVY